MARLDDAESAKKIRKVPQTLLICSLYERQ